MLKSKTFGKELLISIVLILVGIILSFILTIGWLGVIGIPIGLLLACISIWYFTMWFYKKQIKFRRAAWLLLIPALAIISFILEANTDNFFGLLGFEPTTPPNMVPSWLSIISFIYTIALQYLLWFVGIVIIFYFFKKSKID